MASGNSEDLRNLERLLLARHRKYTHAAFAASHPVDGVINIITKNAKDTGGAVTTTGADQEKQQGTSVYSMSSCLWGKWLLQLSKTTE
jgi:hypothetical protein